MFYTRKYLNTKKNHFLLQNFTFNSVLHAFFVVIY